MNITSPNIGQSNPIKKKLFSVTTEAAAPTPLPCFLSSSSSIELFLNALTAQSPTPLSPARVSSTSLDPPSSSQQIFDVFVRKAQESTALPFFSPFSSKENITTPPNSPSKTPPNSPSKQDISTSDWKAQFMATTSSCYPNPPPTPFHKRTKRLRQEEATDESLKRREIDYPFLNASKLATINKVFISQKYYDITFLTAGGYMNIYQVVSDDEQNGRIVKIPNLKKIERAINHKSLFEMLKTSLDLFKKLEENHLPVAKIFNSTEVLINDHTLSYKALMVDGYFLVEYIPNVLNLENITPEILNKFLKEFIHFALKDVESFLSTKLPYYTEVGIGKKIHLIDLVPENIRLTENGELKLVDTFNGDQSSPDVSFSYFVGNCLSKWLLTQDRKINQKLLDELFIDLPFSKAKIENMLKLLL